MKSNEMLLIGGGILAAFLLVPKAKEAASSLIPSFNIGGLVPNIDLSGILSGVQFGGAVEGLAEGLKDDTASGLDEFVKALETWAKKVAPIPEVEAGKVPETQKQKTETQTGTDIFSGFAKWVNSLSVNVNQFLFDPIDNVETITKPKIKPSIAAQFAALNSAGTGIFTPSMLFVPGMARNETKSGSANANDKLAGVEASTGPGPETARAVQQEITKKQIHESAFYRL